MPLALKSFKARARRYVENEAQTKVKKVSFVKRFRLFGREDIVLSVETTDRRYPTLWVVGGSSPMNLYTKARLPDVDVAYNTHIGLMLRVQDREFKESRVAPDEAGYDAFISHASEDKKRFVGPLVKTLTQMGYQVWYDEFELRVGDSLRRSIDKGLSSSRFGVVVLSPAFFAKNWPQYELDGLTAREIDGHKVILPIWHRIGRQKILAYSAPLADKVALCSPRLSIAKVAKELGKVFDSEVNEA